MTESEWLASGDPQAMLRVVAGQVEVRMEGDVHSGSPRYVLSDRTLRLFACACARQVWHLLTDDCSRKAVEVAERYADGQASEKDLDAAHKVSLRGHYPWQLDEGPDNLRHAAKAAYRVSTPSGSEQTMVEELVRGYNSALGGQLRQQQATLLRDIVGSPWHTYYIEEDNEITYRDCEDSSAQEGHTKSLDQGGGPGRLEDASSLGMGTGWRTASAGRLPDSSHQRRQHGRQADQPGLDPSRGASADARRQAAGEADGAKVSADNTQLQPVWMRVSGTQAKPQSSLLSVSQGKQKGASGKAIPTNGRIIKRSWLTSQVLSLTQAAYDERQDDATLDPVRLSVLADCLEETGCTDEALLQHLRGWEWSPPEDHMGRDKGVWIRLRSPHVRGCWALDLILGKD